MAKLWTEALTGPASYPAGGFVVTTALATVGAVDLVVAVPGSVLGPYEPQIIVDTPSAGQFTVKLLARQFDRLTGLGDPNGLPSGVSVAATSAQIGVADAAHQHSLTHDHASVGSGGAQGGTAGVITAVGGANASTHTHTADPPSFSGTSSVGTAHSHEWNGLYQHQHTAANAGTDVAQSEVTAGTNLSGVTWRALAVGT